MARFNVTRIAPVGFLHHQAFNEVQDSLTWALSSLGHEVSNTFDWFSETRERNIVLVPELYPEFQQPPASTIFYTMEQPSHPLIPKVVHISKNQTLWDKSQRMVEMWKAQGINAIHCPLGYTPNLVRIPKAEVQDIDICFFGWMTPRRVALIDQLRKYGLKVFASDHCYGGGRDQIISRSKVCLDIHHDGRDMFCAPRLLYWMANSKCIVTESASDMDEYEDLRGLTSVPYRLLLDTSISLVKAETERQRLEQAAFISVQKRDYASSVAAALEASPEKASLPSPQPLQHAQERGVQRQAYLQKGRDLRVEQRYFRGLESGDMKDFLPFLRDNAKGNILEIGVRDGASTSAFLLGLEQNGGHLYSIDINDCSHLFAGHPNWTFIEADSKLNSKIMMQVPQHLDLLLIDGDHSREGVLGDLIYMKWVKPGGFVIFHDIRPESKPSGCNDPSWPDSSVKDIYSDLCSQLAERGWAHFEIPGRYGMGVLKAPLNLSVEVTV